MRVLMLVSLVAMTGCSPAMEANSVQFDLHCKGTFDIIPKGGYPEPTQSISNTKFRIDLQANKWCAHECHRVVDIVSASDNEIVLQDYDDLATAGEEGRKNYAVINRRTGSYSGMSDNRNILTESRETCVRRPYSGMAPKF